MGAKTGKDKMFNTGYASKMPGPGMYESKSSFGVLPKYSFGDGHKGVRNNGVPGPGSYTSKNNNLADKLNKGYGTSAGFGTAKRAAFFLDAHKSGSAAGGSQQHLPGPGAYTPSTFGAAPKFGFGTQKKDINYDNRKPGPGAYTGKNDFTKS